MFNKEDLIESVVKYTLFENAVLRGDEIIYMLNSGSITHEKLTYLSKLDMRTSQFNRFWLSEYDMKTAILEPKKN